MSDLSLKLPQNITIRPLNKGVVKDLPSFIVPPEAMLTLENYEVIPTGLRKRGGFSLGAIAGTLPPENTDRLRSVTFAYANFEDLKFVAFGERFAYLISDEEINLVLRTKAETGTPVSKVTVTFHISGDDYYFSLSGLDAGDDVTIGDFLIVTLDSSDYWLRIIDVDGTDMYVKDTNPTSIFSGTTALISATETAQAWVQRGFSSDVLHLPQFTTYQGELYVADNSSRKLLKMDSTFTLNQISSSTGLQDITQITTLCWFNDRLFFGNFTEGGVQKYTTIAWSDYGTPETVNAANRIPIESSTELVRLLPMGPLLVAYFGDSVWFGRNSNNTLYPFFFTRLDTPGIGLMGPNAVCNFLDGHFFVGPDDIYFFSPTTALQALFSPIRDIFKTASFRRALSYSQLIPDPENSRIFFLIPKDNQSAYETWIYSTQTKAWYPWSFDAPIHGGGLVSQSTLFTFADWTHTIGSETRTFREMEPSISKARLFLFSGTTPYLYQNQYVRCSLQTTPVFPLVFETVDLDFNAPDKLKFVSRFNLKIEGFEGSTWDSEIPLTFSIQVSRDRGKTWTTLQNNLIIRQGQDEGKVNFSFKGSLLRFRVTCLNTFQILNPDGVTYTQDPQAENFTVLELGMKVRIGGNELIY